VALVLLVPVVLVLQVQRRIAFEVKLAELVLQLLLLWSSPALSIFDLLQVGWTLSSANHPSVEAPL